MPVAVLDFGTNTFNLLIAEKDPSGIQVLYTGKQGVKLGRGGIHEKIITPDAMERGYNAIEAHLKIISKYQVDEIHVFATSAIRDAKNGIEFVDSVYQRYALTVQVIDGNREAELIYKGVRNAIALPEGNSLILDIGGGSNEFIICNRQSVLWKHSFDLGMARLLEQFNLSDPVTADEIEILENYFRQELSLLFKKVAQYNPKTLIGASGSFETFSSLILHKRSLPVDQRSGRNIQLADYRDIHQALIESTLEERKKMPGMEMVRVEMIVAATIFVNFVIQSCHIKKICQSDFALKEGVAEEIFKSR